MKKIGRFIIRLILFPAIAFILGISYLKEYLIHNFNWLRYGGEMIVYNKRVKKTTVLEVFKKVNELVEKQNENECSFTKEDLEKAWLHGAIRTPKELGHINNFERYYRCSYENETELF